MKKIVENRYPHSATLFRFCKQALTLRYRGNVKVIDQDVGAILGYDPADCSHWKRGKKNIRTLATLKNLAEHLQIDERLLIDITAGKVDLDEALFEFQGYGGAALNERNRDYYRREFLRKPENWQKPSSLRSFDESWDLKRQALYTLVATLHNGTETTKGPISISSAFSCIGNIIIEADPELSSDASIETLGDEGQAILVKYQGSRWKPHTRFLIAKKLFCFFSQSGHQQFIEFSKSPPEILDTQAKLFAMLLLIPAERLKEEVDRLDITVDMVAQLSAIFGVSKTLINQRLQEFLL